MRLKGNQTIQRECVICGKPFVAYGYNRMKKTCSVGCQVENRKRNDKLSLQKRKTREANVLDKLPDNGDK